MKLRFFILIVLLLGIFFRFYNLDHKLYWHDETYTSLRISGYTTQELISQVFDGRVISRQDLQKYQQPHPEKSLSDTIRSLALEDCQHSPLYYILARWWVHIFGYSVTSIRSLSASISLLVFPAVYWLCWELFAIPLVGWLAIAIVSLSPFQLLYAQEAREYILWTVTTLLSCATLLQAIRLKTNLAWAIYAASLAIGFYTFILTALVAIGQGIYLVVTQGFRFNKTVKSYLFASLAAIIAFLPWIWVIMTNFATFVTTTSWTNQPSSNIIIIKSLVGKISDVFIDFDLNQSIIVSLLKLIIVLLVGYSLYFICRHTPRSTWLLILSLMLGLLLFTLSDLILGGQRSTINRYLIPSFLAIQLAVAYLLATKIQLQPKIWQAIASAILLVGLSSCLAISQAETWLNKGLSYDIPTIAKQINQANQPLIIGTLSTNVGNLGNLLSLSYRIKPEARFQLVVDSKVPQLPQDLGEVFLFNPTKTLQAAIEQQYQSKAMQIFKSKFIVLWKLSKKSALNPPS
jgi:uncharacterized membrane protein